jgi:D-alanyl-D-alanine carboxypeptidase
MSVGSVSKTFVAALVGRLATRGVLSLNDHLDKYVPNFPDAAAITVRELLNHTSGIRDVFDAPGMADAILNDPTRTWTPDEVLAAIGSPYFTPGTGYHYSNTDYLLLGKVVEKATGKTVAELVRSEFLSPLDLTHTFLQTEESAEGMVAHGYMAPPLRATDNFAGTMIPFNSEATSVGCAGAYVSTATDLARWATALYSGQILDQATLADMVDITQTMSFPAKPKTPYGLGLEQLGIDNQVAWGHRGHLDGFWTAMEYLPDIGITIVVVTNGDWANPVDLAAALGAVLIPQPETPPAG